MAELFYTILYEPIFNALIGLYHVLPLQDLGIAIIIVTIFIKLLLFYPNYRALKNQKALQDVQPKMEELKEKYKDDKEELGRQLMTFYKENRVNPFSSCLPMLIQLPVIWALYKVFFAGVTLDPSTGLLAADQVQHLYGALKDIYATTPLHTISFGFIDLTKNHAWYLAILAGAAQFVSSKLLQTKRPPMAKKAKGAQDEMMMSLMNKQMLYFFPIITVIFGWQFPAGVTLYWLVSTLFTLGQQWLILGKVHGKKNKEEKVLMK
jgi:YidC/Oxa1 family membrane protein insertase